MCDCQGPMGYPVSENVALMPQKRCHSCAENHRLPGKSTLLPYLAYLKHGTQDIHGASLCSTPEATYLERSLCFWGPMKNSSEASAMFSGLCRWSRRLFRFSAPLVHAIQMDQLAQDGEELELLGLSRRAHCTNMI